jgi:hypothetical protein
LNKTLINKNNPSMAPNSTYIEKDPSPEQPSSDAVEAGGPPRSGFDPSNVFTPQNNSITGSLTPAEYRQKMIDARAAKKAASGEVGG